MNEIAVHPPDAEQRARITRADRISGVILVVLMLAAFGLVAHTVFEIATGPLPPGPGIPAPQFSTTTPDGAAIGLAQYKGQVVLVDFWATWCPPCIASMPSLERVYAEYKDKGFVVVGVNQEAGDEDLVRKFLRDRSITFPIGMDNGRISRDYGVFTFPTSFLIGKDGVIRATYRGVSQESRLRRDIEEQLQ